MTGKILRDAIIIGGIALATVYAVINKEKIYEYVGFELPAKQQAAEQAQNTSTAQNALPMTEVRGVAVSIPKSKTDGQYWTNARVNNGLVNFLVDTGASMVALTPEDARRAGIRLNELSYDVPVTTAGGQNVAAEVYLKSISVGPVTLRNVRALVIPTGLNTSLLGMTFLGQLQKVEATQQALILRL